MREKVCDLIYLNTKRYTSLSNLRTVYWKIIIFPLLMLIMSVAAINSNGINWKSLFPVVSILVWSLFYWFFVFSIQHKRTKKTFELRFWVNGISGLFISSLIWIFGTSFNLVADNPIFNFDFSLWVLFFYLLFSVTYIALIIVGVHKGVFKRVREKGQTPIVMALDAFFASIIPITGVLGMITAKSLRTYADISVQNIVATISFVLIIFLPALAHINFVQFYYCKKYGIDCDEYGDKTSPDLERKINPQKIKVKQKKEKLEHPNISEKESSKKKVPFFIKIFIGILGVPVVLFMIVFLVFFVKGFIKGIT